MTKTDLIAQVAEQTSLTKKDSAAAIDAVFTAITSALAQGDGLSLTGFGSFAVAERAAKEGRNPKTGEKMVIAASKAVKFKPGKALRDSIN
jgi:DNA-binding protein HU-beta